MKRATTLLTLLSSYALFGGGLNTDTQLNDVPGTATLGEMVAAGAGREDCVSTNDFNEATNRIEQTKRDRTSLAVVRKVKDIWTWTSYVSNEWSSVDAPADFLDTANSPGSMPLHFESGIGTAGGWFGATQYWPNGRVKYDQENNFSGELGALSTNLVFAFTARSEDGHELYRFCARAQRESATDERLVSWDGCSTGVPVTVNKFVRIATTDFVERSVSNSVVSATNDVLKIAERTVAHSVSSPEIMAVKIGFDRARESNPGYFTSERDVSVTGLYAVGLGASVVADGNATTAVGKNALAHGSASVAIGAGALAVGDYSYVIGGGTADGYSEEWAFRWYATNTETAERFDIPAPSTVRADLVDNWVTYTATVRVDEVDIECKYPSRFDGKVGSGGTYDVYRVLDGSGLSKISTTTAAFGTNTLAVGKNASVFGDQSTAIGYTARVVGNNGTALGAGSRATSNALAICGSAHAVNSVAIMRGASVRGRDSVALGQDSMTEAANATAIGAYTAVMGPSGVAVGTSAKTESAGGYETAVGVQATVNAHRGTAVGALSTATTRGTAIGSFAQAKNSDSVAIGCEAVSAANYAVQIGVGTNSKPSSIKFMDKFLATENYVNDNISSNISASNQAFSNAVLSVQVDTNALAKVGEMYALFEGLPVDPVTGGVSVGALLAALAAAVAWLKKRKVDKLTVTGTSIEVAAENGVAKLDDFFTESNGFTPPGKVAGALQNSILEKSIVLAVTENFADADTTSYGGQN